MFSLYWLCFVSFRRQPLESTLVTSVSLTCIAVNTRIMVHIAAVSVLASWLLPQTHWSVSNMHSSNYTKLCVWTSYNWDVIHMQTTALLFKFLWAAVWLLTQLFFISYKLPPKLETQRWPHQGREHFFCCLSQFAFMWGCDKHPKMSRTTPGYEELPFVGGSKTSKNLEAKQNWCHTLWCQIGFCILCVCVCFAQDHAH